MPILTQKNQLPIAGQAPTARPEKNNNSLIKNEKKTDMPQHPSSTEIIMRKLGIKSRAIAQTLAAISARHQGENDMLKQGGNFSSAQLNKEAPDEHMVTRLVEEKATETLAEMLIEATTHAVMPSHMLITPLLTLGSNETSEKQDVEKQQAPTPLQKISQEEFINLPGEQNNSRMSL